MVRGRAEKPREDGCKFSDNAIQVQLSHRSDFEPSKEELGIPISGPNQ